MDRFYSLVFSRMHTHQMNCTMTFCHGAVFFRHSGKLLLIAMNTLYHISNSNQTLDEGEVFMVTNYGYMAYSFLDMNGSSTVYKEIMKIVNEWDRNDLMEAVDDGYFIEVHEASFSYDETGEEQFDGFHALTWKKFFSIFDEAVRGQAIMDAGVVPEIARMYAEIKIDWEKYILVHKEGTMIEKRKDTYSYREITELYREGMFFVNLESGKMRPDEVVELSNAVWSVITVSDASKVVDVEEQVITENAKQGTYGPFRLIGDEIIISQERFAEYHRLIDHD